MAQDSDSSHIRSFFYIGGEYVSTAVGHILQNQMYVERLSPREGPRQPHPIIFIHGACQSGTNWLNKPDGGKGWASWFLENGYEVYIIDQPHVGRSPWYPQSQFGLFQYPAELIQERFTAPVKYKLWSQASLHTQWPGTGTMGDPIFDTYYASNVPILSNTTEQERTTFNAGVALLDKIGPSILIAHSQGALAGWSWADSRPQFVKALVQLEPKGPPFREAIFADVLSRPWGLTSIPLKYDPPATNLVEPLTMQDFESDTSGGIKYTLQAEPARQLVNLKEVPILIVTAEASYHPIYDHCFIKFLSQAGCTEVENMVLGKIGIHGNGHLMFMEKNSNEIAAKIEAWISKKVSEHSIPLQSPERAFQIDLDGRPDTKYVSD